MIASEVILTPRLRGGDATCLSLILLVGGIAEWHKSRSTVTTEFFLLGESVVVPIGCDIIIVVLIASLGVLLASGILYGHSQLVALCVIGRHIVKLNCLTIDYGVALFGVYILGYDLSEPEELTFVAILSSIRVIKDGLHHWSVITNTIINGHG